MSDTALEDGGRTGELTLTNACKLLAGSGLVIAGRGAKLHRHAW